MSSPFTEFPVPQPIIELAETTLISYLVDVALTSGLTVQLFTYYQAFPNDPWITKAFVYGTYILQIIMIGFELHDAFNTYGSGFGDISSATQVRVSWYMSAMLGGIVSFSAQSFYAYRIYVLSRNRLITWAILVVSLTSTVGVLVVGVFASRTADVASLQNFRDSVAGGIWLGASALSDILIAVWMTYFLTKRDTGFLRTKTIISRLVRVIIETGCMTAFVALSTLILFVATPDHSYYVVGGSALPRLYSIAALMILNSRAKILGGRGIDNSSQGQGTVSGSRVHVGANGLTRPVITMTQEVFADNGLDRDDTMEMKAIGVGRPGNASRDLV